MINKVEKIFQNKKMKKSEKSMEKRCFPEGKTSYSTNTATHHLKKIANIAPEALKREM